MQAVALSPGLHTAFVALQEAVPTGIYRKDNVVYTPFDPIPLFFIGIVEILSYVH